MPQKYSHKFTWTLTKQDTDSSIHCQMLHLCNNKQSAC